MHTGRGLKADLTSNLGLFPLFFHPQPGGARIHKILQCHPHGQAPADWRQRHFVLLKNRLHDELARGEVVWRPLANAKINKIEVGILTPSHRTLSHVTLQFVERIALRLKQVELVASGY